MGQRLHCEERRAQLLEVAAELFAQKGFHRTTTREIARRAGVSEAMIFKHFSSKEEVYAAALDLKGQSQSPQEVVGEAALRKDDYAVFEGIARYYVEKVEKDPAILRLLLFTALEHHELSESFFDTHVRRCQDFLTGYISRRIADGAFKGHDPFLMARSLLGMIGHHLLAQEIFGLKKRFPVGRDEAVSTFVRIFLEGVRRHAA